MDERKIHIDEFFRRQMGNHTETPPPEIWEALEKRLDTPPGRKKPFPVWWFYTIAGLILISATAIIAGYLSNSPAIIAQQQPVPQTVAIVAQPATTQPVPEEIVEQSTIPGNTQKQETPAQPSDNNDKNNFDEVTIQAPEKATEHIAKASQNNIRPINNNSNGTQHHDLSKVPLPALSKHKDEIDVLAPQLPAGNIAANTTTPAPKERVQLPAMPKQKDEIQVMAPQLPADNITTTIIPAPKQPAQLPVLSHDNLRDDEELNTPISSTTAEVNSIQAAELLASINPKGTANAITQREIENIPGPGAATIQEETITPQAGIEQPHTDTTKKKNNFLTEKDTSILEQTVYPVITKKKKIIPIEAGIKVGYSKGFDNTWRADKIAFAPYIEYRLPSNFSVSFQPTYHTGKAKTGTFANGDKSYHQVTGSSFDSSGRVVRGKVDSSVISPNPPDTVFRTYTYGQTYDSMHVRYGVTQTQLWDIELPLIVKYKINDNFSVLAGGSATYSSVLQTSEEVTKYSLAHQYADNIEPVTYYVTTQGQPPPDGPARKSHSDLFKHNTATFDTYQPRQVSVSNNFFRYGFMVGASATFKERWMIDVMLHKTGVNANAVPDKELHKIYTQPYLRVMVGYKLLK